MKKKGFTLIELLVVIAIIAMLLAILMPALSKVKKIAMRVVCGTNLKGLGTAQMVYANDYDDDFVVQGGNTQHTMSLWTGGWQMSTKDWGGASLISVGASLYLLVREADVSPKSFVCPASNQTEYDGVNLFSMDLVELWDFGSSDPGQDIKIHGTGPQNCVSYSYHMPYDPAGGASRYAADGTKSAAFAVMADKSPFFDPKLRQETSDTTVTADNFSELTCKLWAYWISDKPKYQLQVANAQPHDRDGQNVVFADGHSSYEKTSDVAIKHDNIYTLQTPNPTTEVHIRQGQWTVDYTFDNPAGFTLASSKDSVLVNDDIGG